MKLLNRRIQKKIATDNFKKPRKVMLRLVVEAEYKLYASERYS